MARDYIPDEELEECDEGVEVSKAEDKCDRECEGCWGEYVCEKAETIKEKESEELNNADVKPACFGNDYIYEACGSCNVSRECAKETLKEKRVEESEEV